MVSEPPWLFYAAERFVLHKCLLSRELQPKAKSVSVQKNDKPVRWVWSSSMTGTTNIFVLAEAAYAVTKNIAIEIDDTECSLHIADECVLLTQSPTYLVKTIHSRSHVGDSMILMVTGHLSDRIYLVVASIASEVWMGQTRCVKTLPLRSIDIILSQPSLNYTSP